ncbi:MAG: hypothetical protein DWQ42_00665 [Planctomycetota bacterium]|nr:MAG: hypothetical protein DWQ42_00665 [Planctomycetota bacterium]REK40702.1 MAG: hypothetical protein DWQ46_15805 [Planctomycetota bacterium]
MNVHRSSSLSCWRGALPLVALAVALLVLSADFAVACPGCKDAVAANDSQQMNIARGYFWSILFMLSMPALIAGSFGTYVYVELRRARRDQEALQQVPEEAAAPAEEHVEEHAMA